MILTRVQLPYEDAVKRKITDPYAWHQRAWDAFTDVLPVDKTRGRYAKGTSLEQQRETNLPPPFLSRVDMKDDHVQLLLLSDKEPERPDWCPEPGWQSKAIADSFFDQSSYRFSLLANPTRKTRRGKDGRRLEKGRREPITHRFDRENSDGRTVRGLLTWLSDHGDMSGFVFKPNKVKTVCRPRERFVKKGQVGTLHAVEFTGVLTITDRDLFRSAFRKGIGSAKAFGFGMLCVSPI